MPRLGSLEDSIPETERPAFGFVHKIRSPEHKPLPLLEDSLSSSRNLRPDHSECRNVKRLSFLSTQVDSFYEKSYFINTMYKHFVMLKMSHFLAVVCSCSFKSKDSVPSKYWLCAIKQIIKYLHCHKKEILEGTLFCLIDMV